MAELADRHEFWFFRISADFQRMVNDALEQPPEGWDAVTAVFDALGLRAWRPLINLEEIRIQLRAGKPDAARGAADTALADAERTGLGFLSAEIQRLRGEARLALGDAGGAQDVADAAALAQRQGARLFEQRARR